MAVVLSKWERKRLDRVGEKHGKLTIVGSVLHKRRSQYFFLCKCDCGNEVIWEYRNIKRALGCGCVRASKGSVAALRILWERYRVKARKRGYIFTLTKEQFKKLVSQNCSYCNTKPSFESKNPSKGSDVSFFYNGIDRRDNSKGYIIENVVTCCGYCNRAKHQRSEKDFLNWLRNIQIVNDKKSK